MCVELKTKQGIKRAIIYVQEYVFVNEFLPNGDANPRNFVDMAKVTIRYDSINMLIITRHDI